MKKSNLPPAVKIFVRHWIDGDTRVPGQSRVMVDFDQVENIQEHDGSGLGVRSGTPLSLINYHSGATIVVEARFDQVVEFYVIAKRVQSPNLLN